VAVAVTAIYSGTMSWLILKVIDLAVGLRVEEHEEVLGLDTTQHGEAAYTA
jgi:Amt family ammonium transporter